MASSRACYAPVLLERRMSCWIAIACMAAVELWVLRRLGFDWVIVAIVLAGTLVSVDYLSYTSIAQRNYDGRAHLQYIETLAHDGRPPSVYACVACGHPPLYYALAALWSRVVLAGGWAPEELGLQCFSLALSFGFVVFALLILRGSIEQPATLRLAAGLVALWPSTVLNSVRVHNDALAAPLMLAALHYTVQWDRRGRPRDFYAALAASAFSLLTKASGYTTAATLLVFAALRLRSPRLRREGLELFGVAAAVLLGAALLGMSFRQSERPLSLCQRAFGHACDERRAPPAEFELRNFVTFDVRDFVRTTDSLHQESEHDYFLNRLAKSSLFGLEPLGDDFASARHQAAGLVIRIAFLAMLALCLATLPFVSAASWSRYRVLASASAIMLAFLVAFRVRLPNEYHEDFRHIFPLLVPASLAYAKAVERLGRSSRVLYAVGVVAGLSMMGSSVVFFAR